MSDSSAKKRKLPLQPQAQPQSGNGDANGKNKRKQFKKKRRAEAKRLLDNFKLQQEEHHRQLASLELTDYDQKHLGIRLNMVDLEQGAMEQEEATAQRKEGATKEHETKKPDTDARPVKPLPLGEDINTLTAALLDNGKLVSISTFDGAGSLSLQDWLTLLESMDARASDQKRIRTALNKITDQDLLESILAADEEEKSSWEKFKLVLLGDQAERNEALIEQWDSMEQGNLSVVKYWTHFKGTMRRLRASTPHGDFSVTRIRNKFRKGLRPELQLALVLEREGNAESLMKAAKLVETSQKRQNHAPLAAFVQQERTELPQLQQDFLCRSTADQEDMDMEAKRLSVDVLTVFQAISRKNGKCYECGNVGHWRGDAACNGPSRRSGNQPSPNHDRRPCPRHPSRSHDASECFAACPEHPHASHGKRDCPSNRRRQSSAPCFQFQRGHCNFGDRCRFSHDAKRQSEPQFQVSLSDNRRNVRDARPQREDERKSDSGRSHNSEHASRTSGKTHPDRRDRHRDFRGRV